MTDHFLIARKISQLKVHRRKMTTRYYRDKKNFCGEAFSEELYSNLTNIILPNFPFHRENFNDVFDKFVAAISGTIEKHAPLTCRKQARLAKKPWITKGMFTSIKKKNSIFAATLLMVPPMKKAFFANIQTFSPNSRPCQRKYTSILKSTITSITHVRPGILHDWRYETSEAKNLRIT